MNFSPTKIYYTPNSSKCYKDFAEFSHFLLTALDNELQPRKPVHFFSDHPLWSKDAPAKSNTTIPGHCNSLSNVADYIKASTILHVQRLPSPHRRITLIPHGKKHGESNTLFAYQLMIFFPV